MAELRRDGEELVVALSIAEKAEAAHGDIRVPTSSVREVEVVEDAIHAFPAWSKTVGAGWPGRFAIGTFREANEKIFAVVHHGTPRGVKVTLEGVNFDVLVVGCADPEEVVSSLGAF
jgi:hypothetical protein